MIFNVNIRFAKFLGNDFQLKYWFSSGFAMIFDKNIGFPLVLQWRCPRPMPIIQFKCPRRQCANAPWCQWPNATAKDDVYLIQLPFNYSITQINWIDEWDELLALAHCQWSNGDAQGQCQQSHSNAWCQWPSAIAKADWLLDWLLYCHSIELIEWSDD